MDMEVLCVEVIEYVFDFDMVIGFDDYVLLVYYCEQDVEQELYVVDQVEQEVLWGLMCWVVVV